MNIGVDAGCLGISDKRLQVGVFQVVKNLLIELGKNDKKNNYILYSFLPIDKKLVKQFGPRMINCVVTPQKGWLSIWLPLRLLKDQPDVFFAPNQAAPLRLPTTRYKIVGLFHDIAFEKYPSLYEYAASVAKHKRNSAYLSMVSDKIIAVSKNTKNDICATYRTPIAKVSVAYPGVVALPRAQATVGAHPYFLFVGSWKKSKNIPKLLKAFSLFYKQSEKQYELLLVGGNKWLDEEIESVYTLLPKQVRESVTFLNFVSEKKLARLYTGACAFVSPSWYEGFGLPFLEAQRMGCPVIGSNRGSLPEVIGKSGILVNPSSEKEIADSMQYMTKSEVRKKFIALGYKNVQKYTWKKFAKKVQSVIESLS